MMPMQCPSCSSKQHRALVTNSQLPDQVVRKRRCLSCGHQWFTAEVFVPSYAVGWSTAHQNKPVLRVPLELAAGHTNARLTHEEPRDTIALLRAANERRSAEADERYAM